MMVSEKVDENMFFLGFMKGMMIYYTFNQFVMEFELIGEQIEAVKTAFPAHSDSIETISAKPNGREIATGSHDHTIKLWDVETMKSTQTLSEHRQGVWTLDYSPDGALLLSGSADGTLLLWDTKQKKPVRTYKGADKKVYWAKFNQGGNLIASCGQNSPIVIWDVMNGGPVKKFCDSEVGYCVEWSKKGKYLVSSHFSGDINVFDSKTYNLIATTKTVGEIPDHNRVYGIGLNDNDHDFKIYAACQDKLLKCYALNGTTLHETKKIDGIHFDEIKSVSVNLKKNLMLTTGRDGALRVWSLNHQNPHLHCNLIGLEDNIGKAVFVDGPGTIVAAASWDQKLCLWKTN